MVKIEEIAQAALDGDALKTRSLTQDFILEHRRLDNVPKPVVKDQSVLVTSAALIELFARRLHQKPPAWTRTVGALDEPVYLVKSARRMRRLRELCEKESPLPLRKRKLYAPPNYLEFA